MEIHLLPVDALSRAFINLESQATVMSKRLDPRCYRPNGAIAQNPQLAAA